ncbi:D-alanyl-D-alanine carboxypeptidase family protein [Eubacterium oxidoreducens]|uniref:D-alanyl-D-alanine carboxypeptidase n=1 Tax=Eubacterium oxidoreducens TaxID=1732 RepID=A0A1G5ZZK9_EUBOX|nr:D-alanyl-D-alanine carboxypeptidase family protein [Eubacterium oxidoreducens]SDB01631.1 D-alanyl-D-alanine carboxypeptidase [Eubacterium oxidoreducens]
MKKLIAICGLISCILLSGIMMPMDAQAETYWPDDVSVESASAIVMDADTGTVLYEKKADTKRYPASITKIMTALLAIENGNLEDTVTFSSDAVYKTEGSSIMRDVGEELTLEQCLYGMMLESANDCAYAIAEHVGGDYDTFIKMMNDKATELGCTGTHFVNPNGLPDEDHYVTARDMALIAKAAYQNETFRIITGTTEYKLPATNKHDEALTMHNHHAMIYPYHTSAYLTDYCTGGKTGYTIAAGSTLVTYAEKDGMSLIVVVLKAQTPAHYTDTIKLCNYCFDNFQILNVSENETTEDISEIAGNFNTNEEYLEIDPDATVIVPKTVSFSDLTRTVDTDCETSEIAGKLVYSYGDKEVGSALVQLTGAQIEEFEFNDGVQSSDSSSSEDSQLFRSQINWPLLIIIIAVIVVVLIIVLYILRNGLPKKKKKSIIIKDNYRKKRRGRRR